MKIPPTQAWQLAAAREMDSSIGRPNEAVAQMRAEIISKHTPTLIAEQKEPWHTFRSLNAQIAALLLEKAELRQALEPFAEFARCHQSMRTLGSLTPSKRTQAIYSICTKAGNADITVGMIDEARHVLNK